LQTNGLASGSVDILKPLAFVGLLPDELPCGV